jgi:hypothetical protein
MGGSGFFEQTAAAGLITYRTKRTLHSGPLGLVWNSIHNSYADFNESYSFQAEPGKVYFLRWTPIRNSDLPDIKPVEEGDALRDLAKLKSFPPATEQ